MLASSPQLESVDETVVTLGVRIEQHAEAHMTLLHGLIG